MSKTKVESILDYGLSSDGKPKQLFSKIGIVGCGQVGQRIASMMSEKEFEVVFIDLSEDKIQEGIKQIGLNLDELITKWSMTKSEKRAILSRIKGSTNYSALKKCDLVIESIRSEHRMRQVSARKEVFERVEAVVSPECIISTNTTTVIITELSESLKYKDRCISLNFLEDFPNAKAIEYSKGLYTSDPVCDKISTFIRLLEKEPIPVTEAPGLITVRIFIAQLNEACEILMEGVGSLENIDKAMKLVKGQTLGPFETADAVGIDKINRWMENLYHEYGDPKYKASPILKRLERLNHLGVLTGHGFYNYDENGKKTKGCYKH